MLRFLSLFLFNILIVLKVNLGAAYAEENSKDIILGEGTLSCTWFLNATVNNPETEIAFFSWAAGYMSGINNMIASQYFHYHDLGYEKKKQMPFVRKFCEDNPKLRYLDAVLALYATFPMIEITKVSQ